MSGWAAFRDYEACAMRRGGRRSQVICEKPEGHGDEHCGRGKDGRWFSWVSDTRTEK
jgi:hypothetical protein